MSGALARFGWAPPFAAGIAGAVAGEMCLGLLLFDRSGFLPSATLVLCMEMAALAAGLWLAPQDAAPPWAGLRRAWLLLLVTMLGGAAVAAGWEALGGLSASWIARGMGLAFLGAMPLYATGLVLGAAPSEGSSTATRTAPALGASVGFAVVGLARTSVRLAPFSYVAAGAAVAAATAIGGRLLAERELRWKEWAQHGRADEQVAPPTPRSMATPVPDALRARPRQSPTPPGTQR